MYKSWRWADTLAYTELKVTGQNLPRTNPLPGQNLPLSIGHMQFRAITDHHRFELGLGHFTFWLDIDRRIDISYDK